MRPTTHKPEGNPIASPNLLLRSGGFWTIVAGVLFASWGYLHQDRAPQYFNVIAHLLAGIVPALFIVGLATLWAQCAGRATRLAHTGILVGLIGSALGIIRSLVDVAVPSWYPHDALSGRALVVLDVWTPTLFSGLLLVGVALVGTKTLRILGAFVLAGGSFGWAYHFTDSGAIFEARLVHVGFGVLFSLSWVAMGLALWRGAAREAKPEEPRTSR
jgi:hypothetical protein